MEQILNPNSGIHLKTRIEQNLFIFLQNCNLIESNLVYSTQNNENSSINKEKVKKMIFEMY